MSTIQIYHSQELKNYYSDLHINIYHGSNYVNIMDFFPLLSRGYAFIDTILDMNRDKFKNNDKTAIKFFGLNVTYIVLGSKYSTDAEMLTDILGNLISINQDHDDLKIQHFNSKIHKKIKMDLSRECDIYSHLTNECTISRDMDYIMKLNGTKPRILSIISSKDCGLTLRWRLSLDKYIRLIIGMNNKSMNMIKSSFKSGTYYDRVGNKRELLDIIIERSWYLKIVFKSMAHLLGESNVENDILSVYNAYYLIFLN